MSGWRHLCALALLVTLGALPEPQPGGVAWTDAQIARLHENVDAALEAPALRGAYVGLLAIDTVRGTELYSRSADDEFTPGSNFKLLVGSAALRYLGPGFRFATTLSSDVPRKDGFVSGTSICTEAATRICAPPTCARPRLPLLPASGTWTAR